MTMTQQNERFRRLAEKRRAVDAKLARWLGFPSPLAPQQATIRNSVETASRPVLARDVPGHLAMAAGTARVDANRADRRRVELELDPATRWGDESSAFAWTSANVQLALEISADGEKAWLVFSNTEDIPDEWTFAAVGLTTGHVPELPPPGTATMPDPSIAVELPHGLGARDVRRVAVYVCQLGMATLGCLVFRLVGKGEFEQGP